MSTEADAIASAVLDQFDKLPQNRKPIVRDNGLREWVPLSGIVAKERNGSLTCLALATGMKCLPASKVAGANGGVLHDWHAEILAIRALNHLVLEECRLATNADHTSQLLRRRDADEAVSEEGNWQGQPFELREGITLHMYCSEAPCGDASMELTMAAQDDASPWDIPPVATDGTSQDASLLGRGFFSQLGIVRRKPARADAPPTLSKSCSDKIALKQCTSLLNAVTSLLVFPKGAYISSLILPDSQYSHTACQRAFSADGRMAPLRGVKWPGGYAYTPFEVQTTTREFSFSGRSHISGEKTVASNIAVAWSQSGLEETLIGGVLQGRKQGDPRGASLVSRKKLWALALDVVNDLGPDSQRIRDVLSSTAYGDLKQAALLTARETAKRESRELALKGWARNMDDSAFSSSTPRSKQDI